MQLKIWKQLIFLLNFHFGHEWPNPFRQYAEMLCVWEQGWYSCAASVCVRMFVAEDFTAGYLFKLKAKLGLRNQPKLAKDAIYYIFLYTIPLLSPVVSEGSVRQIWWARTQGSPWPVVSMVSVVRLLKNLWRRGHVQGTLLHQPEVINDTVTSGDSLLLKFTVIPAIASPSRWKSHSCVTVFIILPSLGQKEILESYTHLKILLFWTPEGGVCQVTVNAQEHTHTHSVWACTRTHSW